MNKFMKQNWFKVSFLVIVIVIIGWVFYWFQFRPAEIRKECYKFATGIQPEITKEEINNSLQKGEDLFFDPLKKRQSFSEDSYNNCLKRSGLER